jgi:hypothetical protein
MSRPLISRGLGSPILCTQMGKVGSKDEQHVSIEGMYRVFKYQACDSARFSITTTHQTPNHCYQSPLHFIHTNYSTRYEEMFTQRTLSRIPRAAKSSLRTIHSTPTLLHTATKEEQTAHTATQRIRYWIKSLPVETYPLCKLHCTKVVLKLMIGNSRGNGVLTRFWCLFVCETGVAGSYVEVEEEYCEGCWGWSLKEP